MLLLHLDYDSLVIGWHKHNQPFFKILNFLIVYISSEICCNFHVLYFCSEKVIVGITDIVSAIKKMFQALYIKVIRSCSKLSKIFLAAMVHELCKTRINEMTFKKDEDN